VDTENFRPDSYESGLFRFVVEDIPDTP
jgi:hypothetical protein